MGDLGGFAGMCALPARYKEPLLVSCTDGVGTKLKLAFLTGRHDTVGIDLVAMNVNDMIVCGAEPLLFLDYFASGKLDVGIAERVVAGIADGCQAAGCALIGGETAELPGFYADGEYDLAGFSVGVVEKSRRVDGSAIRAGDRLLGLASSGFHSNGYSLVRRVFLDHMKLPLDAAPPGLGEPLAAALLRPTRMLPGDARLKLRVHLDAWKIPPLFGLLARGGDVAGPEMLRTFNMGIGMVVCVPADRAPEAETLLQRAGEQVFPIGEVAAAEA